MAYYALLYVGFCTERVFETRNHRDKRISGYRKYQFDEKTKRIHAMVTGSK